MPLSAVVAGISTQRASLRPLRSLCRIAYRDKLSLHDTTKITTVEQGMRGSMVWPWWIAQTGGVCASRARTACSSCIRRARKRWLTSSLALAHRRCGVAETCANALPHAASAHHHSSTCAVLEVNASLTHVHRSSSQACHAHSTHLRARVCNEIIPSQCRCSPRPQRARLTARWCWRRGRAPWWCCRRACRRWCWRGCGSTSFQWTTSTCKTSVKPPGAYRPQFADPSL